MRKADIVRRIADATNLTQVQVEEGHGHVEECFEEHKKEDRVGVSSKGGQ